MKSKNEILGILGKIEANVQLGQNKVDLIEGNEWEVNSLKNNLARIKELIEEVTKEEEPEKSEAREAMETGDWGKFFDTFTK